MTNIQTYNPQQILKMFHYVPKYEEFLKFDYECHRILNLTFSSIDKTYFSSIKNYQHTCLQVKKFVYGDFLSQINYSQIFRPANTFNLEP